MSVREQGGVEISVHGLVCRFGQGGDEVAALDGLDLVAPRGRVTAVVGPSGAGKSTLLRAVAGLTRPDAGDVCFDGRSVAGLAPEKRRLGVVFQSYALFPHLTVADNVAFAARVRGVGRKKARAGVREALERLEIGHLADRLPQQLSGGERQRVALARALAAEPRALLLDEPLAALDARLRLALRAELAERLRAAGLTAIYVTHDQEEAMALGDRVAVLRAGRLEQVGTPEELYR
ncbi:MAG TPA: ABC transporter ATP-binding protein, partial [Thermoanaerobaculia bacterium]|nr:ABC transporter ATP-binding protein [Thermoanaerobaculia bacterium]